MPKATGTLFWTWLAIAAFSIMMGGCGGGCGGGGGNSVWVLHNATGNMAATGELLEGQAYTAN